MLAGAKTGDSRVQGLGVRQCDDEITETVTPEHRALFLQLNHILAVCITLVHR